MTQPTPPNRYGKQRSEGRTDDHYVKVLRRIMPKKPINNGTPEQFEAMKVSIERGKELVAVERGKK